jgi:hypothetical protein
MPNKTRPSHFHDIKVDRFRIADDPTGMAHDSHDAVIRSVRAELEADSLQLALDR